MLEAFQFFADCGIQSLVVSWGVRLNTFQGFFSYVVNMAFILTPMIVDTQWQQTIVDIIERAQFQGNTEDYALLGKYVGTIAASVVQF